MVAGTKIAAIGPNLHVPERDNSIKVIDAKGMLAMPGLINGHIHSPGNFQKGSLDGMPLEIFMLYEVPPFSHVPPSPRLNYIRTMLGNIEMLKLGVTSVYDDAFYVPIPTPEAIDGLMQSYADSGIRVAAALDQPMVIEYEKFPYLYDLLPDSIRREMVIHAIWVDDDDITLMARSGCSVAHNPGCNLRLGSGVMPFRVLMDSGIPICLGSDEAIAEDTANMWEVGKLAGLIHTISDPEYHNWPKAQEIIWALTRGGAQAMRNKGRVGVLAPGYEADLILLDLNTLAFTPLNDIYRQLVYCENGSSVRMTMVAGEIVVKDGKVLTVDEESVKSEARELMKAYRVELEKSMKTAARLEPYYREMYLRSAASNVDMNRWVHSS